MKKNEQMIYFKNVKMTLNEEVFKFTQNKKNAN